MNAKEIAEKYVYGKHDALTDAQEIIDMTSDIEKFADQFKPKWIPVEERLPEIGERVMLIAHGKAFVIGKLQSVEEQEDRHYTNSILTGEIVRNIVWKIEGEGTLHQVLYKITHWMPTPPTP